MAAKDNESTVEELLDRVNSIAEELAAIKEELGALGIISDISEKIEEMSSEISEIKESQNNEKLSKRFDDFADAIDEIKSSVKDMAESKETEVMIKKIDDILISLTESDVVEKKLDDLQGYIAGLSSIEETIQDLSKQFEETNEIVGIIVRQLDDIERKYNQSIDKISETADMVTRIMESTSLLEPSDTKTVGKKPAKSDDEHDAKEKTPTVSKANLPSTIDVLINRLLDLVNPQTEATEMAKALEEVRDQLTTMIKGHTPVLYQFGKRARDLESYPPTATLNENDIATLNKEIKSWGIKLKEIAKSS